MTSHPHSHVRQAIWWLPMFFSAGFYSIFMLFSTQAVSSSVCLSTWQIFVKCLFYARHPSTLWTTIKWSFQPPCFGLPLIRTEAAGFAPPSMNATCLCFFVSVQIPGVGLEQGNVGVMHRPSGPPCTLLLVCGMLSTEMETGLSESWIVVWQSDCMSMNLIIKSLAYIS